MGGVPVLLMIAAMGITYGWQPDEGGGVEYIIQIPPEQLREIERLGEISSAIDPAVQGRVSRVVIKVGDSPLPRTMPPRVAQQGAKASQRLGTGVIAASDHWPVPIPEMQDLNSAIPIPSMDLRPGSSTASGQAAVMKPDPEDGRGALNFTIPPPSLSEAAAGAATNVDRAGRELTTRAGEQFDSLLGRTGNPPNAAADTFGGGRISPPATRNPNASAQPPTSSLAAPQFTGSDPSGELARRRAGGPSTEPTTGRDNSWNGYAGARPGGPTTDPATSNAFDSNSRFPPRSENTAAENPASSRLGNDRFANGIGPNDTFGKLPAGMSLPGTSEQSSNVFADPSTKNTGALYSQYEQSQLDQQSRLGGTAYGSQIGSINNDLRFGTDPRSTSTGSTSTGTASQGYGQAGYGQNYATAPATPTQAVPDRRLTAAEIAAGAWSIDNYNRLLDRRGQLVDMTTAQSQSPWNGGVNSYPAAPPSANIPLRADATVPPYTTRQTQESYPYSEASRGDPRSVATAASTRTDPPPQTDPGAFRDPPSLSDRRATGSTSSPVIDDPQTVAAQPLFNGLLLLSVVANIYLFFWLKNLRLRFHDLVAAKRVASSNNSAA